ARYPLDGTRSKVYDWAVVSGREERAGRRPDGELAEELDTVRIVARIQAGDSELFGALYTRYFDRVYGYLRVALNDPHEAEDGAQQGFVKVFQALPGYEQRSHTFSAWLFTIVRNHLRDELRRRGRLKVLD